jgi:hypothetical protein
VGEAAGDASAVAAVGVPDGAGVGGPLLQPLTTATVAATAKAASHPRPLGP